jgi:allene oxide cyclase
MAKSDITLSPRRGEMKRLLVPGLAAFAAILVFAVVNATAGHEHEKAPHHTPGHGQPAGGKTQHHTPAHSQAHGDRARHDTPAHSHPHGHGAQHHTPNHSHSHAGGTIHVVEHATTDEVINGAATDTGGDILTFANEVFDGANAAKVGSDQGACVRTIVGKAWECMWTTFLPHGQLTVEGPFYDASDSTLAITGGTGIYGNARGSMDLKYRNPAGTEFDFIFHVIG